MIEHSIQTYYGRYFNLLEPEGYKFDICEIAFALSNLCRFGGHCRPFYSVAQHCVIVSQDVPPEDAMAGLLHDAAEAFLGDITKPLKTLLPEYKKLETRVEKAIFAFYGLPEILPESVKKADLAALATERYYLLQEQEIPWGKPVNMAPKRTAIHALPPNAAYLAFLQRFYQLKAEAKYATP